MRVTMEVDDELLRQAQKVTGIGRKAAVLRAALSALIQQESARQLARLGGSSPDARKPPRRRSTRR